MTRVACIPFDRELSYIDWILLVMIFETLIVREIKGRGKNLESSETEKVWKYEKK